MASDTPAGEVIARVGEEPIRELPQDLYIPPDALEVFLTTFEGPLDLLLYLIRKQNMDILAVDVSAVTEQYMEYIRVMEAMRFELAAEYLVMAATLAEIKSRFLLPRRQEAEEEEDDPRAELLRRLLEYERYKQAAEDLDALPRLERDVFAAQVARPKVKREAPRPQVSLGELLDAMRDVLRRASLRGHHHVEREKLSTRERMSQILERLNHEQFVPFVALFRPEEGRLGVVVTFLALLELVKESVVELIQNEPFSPIHVRARASREEEVDDAAATT
ncbi:ScpA family protein [Hahella sp. SMD15-11]|uniref:Segregation and condensation protein A n=1 Tax=Thermohahella caldifontis TaxID=3142973 RepID=A0AB39UZA1_9GAMM